MTARIQRQITPIFLVLAIMVLILISCNPPISSSTLNPSASRTHTIEPSNTPTMTLTNTLTLTPSLTPTMTFTRTFTPTQTLSPTPEFVGGERVQTITYFFDGRKEIQNINDFPADVRSELDKLTQPILPEEWEKYFETLKYSDGTQVEPGAAAWVMSANPNANNKMEKTPLIPAKFMGFVEYGPNYDRSTLYVAVFAFPVKSGTVYVFSKIIDKWYDQSPYFCPLEGGSLPSETNADGTLKEGYNDDCKPCPQTMDLLRKMPPDQMIYVLFRIEAASFNSEQLGNDLEKARIVTKPSEIKGFSIDAIFSPTDPNN